MVKYDLGFGCDCGDHTDHYYVIENKPKAGDCWNAESVPKPETVKNLPKELKDFLEAHKNHKVIADVLLEEDNGDLIDQDQYMWQ